MSRAWKVLSAPGAALLPHLYTIQTNMPSLLCCRHGVERGAQRVPGALHLQLLPERGRGVPLLPRGPWPPLPQGRAAID